MEGAKITLTMTPDGRVHTEFDGAMASGANLLWMLEVGKDTVKAAVNQQARQEQRQGILVAGAHVR